MRHMTPMVGNITCALIIGSSFMKRRDFIKSATTLAALPLVSRAIASSTSKQVADQSVVQNEDFWQKVRDNYQLPKDVIQLENGNWGVMSKSVLRDYFNQTENVNRFSSLYTRREFYSDFKPILKRVANLLGCDSEEIAFARGASEVLNNLISGYRNLGSDDAVMYADVDYDTMQAAMRQRGLKVVKIDLPEEGSADDYVDYYRRALVMHPEVKLLLLTHLSHRHGLVLPIKKIVSMAKEFSVDCIVDAAHSWGQIDFNVKDLGADFVGFNLHKWIGAPLGCGVMYVKRGRLADISPAIGDSLDFNPANNIGKIYNRIHTGTFNYAAWLSIPAALDFHETLGAKMKSARLRYLRDYWVSRARELPNIQVVSDNAPDLHAAISSFRVGNNCNVDANRKIATQLLQKNSIFSVHRTGLAKGACVRITPAVFTLSSEMDTLLESLTRLKA